MSGKAGESGTGEHGPALIEGLSTAVSWLTIWPARGASTFDRITGARAMAAMPVAGLVLGLPAAIISAAALSWGAQPLLVAVLIVLCFELGSRLMHIDGLADVGDALGSYAPPERAQQILADKYTGALGMGAVLLTLLAQVAGLSAIAKLGPWGAIYVLTLPALARTVALIGCHRSFRPFSTTGFGSLIIGTVHTWWIVAWLVVLLGSCGVTLWWFAGISPYPLLGATLTSVVGIWLFARHCQRRFNGLNGDCIGTLIELSVAIAAVTLGLWA